MTVRTATAADVDAIAASEADNLGADAWSHALVEEGVAGRLPTVHYLVAEEEHRLVGHAVASLAGDVAELQRIAVAAEHRRAGVATALLDEVLALAAAGGADRVLLEVREDNARRARLLRRTRLRRGGPAPALLPRRCHRGRPPAPAGGGSPDQAYPDPYDFDYAAAPG